MAEQKIKVLSLFDGISCARVALERAGILIETYYSSEIDKYAIQIAQKNYPDTIQLGDIEKLKGKDFTGIDLICGGSPCQDLSIAGKRAGLKGDRSKLFYDFVKLVKEIKPKYFILENVASMSKENKRLMTEALFDIEPTMIDASLVSAQSRRRLFWIGSLQENGTYQEVKIHQPEDRGILLKDILEDEVDEKYFIKGKHLEFIQRPDKLKKKYTQLNGEKTLTMTARQYSNWNGTYIKRVGHFNNGGQGDRIYSSEGKSVSLSALGGGRGAKTGLYAVANRTYPRTKKERIKREKGDSMVMLNQDIRKLTPIECERLQGLQDNFTSGVSDTQRYKMLGNAFNVDVVAWIVSFIFKIKGCG